MFRRRPVDPEIIAENRRGFFRLLGNMLILVGLTVIYGIVRANWPEGPPSPDAAPTAHAITQPSRLTVQSVAVACADSADLSRLTRYVVDNDQEAYKRASLRLLASERCTVLQPGEAVILVKAGLISNKVRRPGDLAEYWVARERVK